MAGYSYLDAAAGAPLHPVAREALLAAQEDGYADPGKLYAPARRARQLLDAARGSLAESIGVRADEVRLCENGSRAAHAAVLGSLAAAGQTTTLVHSAIEHSAVLAAARSHVANGGSAVSVPVDRLGRVDVDRFAAMLREPGVALAALISASHEMGTTQPVAEAAAAASATGVPLYVDAAASLGRQQVPTGWSLLTASARKWGGPPGVGVLVVRKGTRWRAPWPVTEESAPDPPGGLNLPAVVAAAAALRAVRAEQEAEHARLFELVAYIRRRVAAGVPDVEVVGDPVDRLPHLVTFSCLYVDGESLLHALDRAGFAVSSGSSCTSSTLTPSHVLVAAGVLSHGNVRLSLHRGTTAEEIDRFLAVLPGIVADLRAQVDL